MCISALARCRVTPRRTIPFCFALGPMPIIALNVPNALSPSIIFFPRGRAHRVGFLKFALSKWPNFLTIKPTFCKFVIEAGG